MRPGTFQDFALTTLTSHATVTGARPLPDVGETRYPYGLAIRVHDGTEYRWQITAESAPGDKYSETEQPGDGEPATLADAPAGPAGGGPFGLADADELLAHVLTHAKNRQIRTVRRRDGGLTIRCHTGATIYLRALDVPATARR